MITLWVEDYLFPAKSDLLPSTTKDFLPTQPVPFIQVLVYP